MNAASTIKGKTAVVTGAGRGIGRAIARRLGALGANVVIASRTSEQLEETRRSIERDGARALAVVADVTDAEDVDRLMSATDSLFGGVDILVNNAGFAPMGPIEEMEPPLFDRIIATNIRSVHLCTRAAWPHLARGGGVVVNISSVAAYDPLEGLAVYGAAKAFVNAYTRSLAAEGKAAGIRVYGVAPGAVETGMLRGLLPDYPAEKTLEPDEVAALVELLLAPACRYVSGQTLVINKDA